MKIENFNNSHIAQANEIVKINYEEERQHVPILPMISTYPGLKHFAENKMGVAAVEGDKLIGFLSAFYPIEDAFKTTNVRGTFSPIHAHGVLGSNRDKIYTKLYQAAAKIWVEKGISSHAIALYTHDKETIKSFFYNGFGLRCIDAIRPMKEIPLKTGPNNNYLEYCEVARKEWGRLLEHHNSLILHLGSSPIFMKHSLMDEEELYQRSSEDVRYFAVAVNNQFIAYIKIGADGENFVADDNGIMNICGAFCVPEYRGTGIYHNLLSFVISILKKEGYTHLVVDCESINPNARGFWLKHFTEYTHSVVRRIDEKAV